MITVASEIMAVLCLAEDINDLKKRLGSIIVAYNYEGEPVTAADLKADGAMTLLLKDAIMPNIVQQPDTFGNVEIIPKDDFGDLLNLVCNYPAFVIH